MNQESEFARQHPGLDRALREQIRAPSMDAAFGRQVMARIATQRAALFREATAPVALRSRLRARLLLQLANAGAVSVSAILVCMVAWPRLDLAWGWATASAVAAAALLHGLHGLHRAQLLGWARRLAP